MAPVSLMVPRTYPCYTHAAILAVPSMQRHASLQVANTDSGAHIREQLRTVQLTVSAEAGMFCVDLSRRSRVGRTVA